MVLRPPFKMCVFVVLTIVLLACQPGAAAVQLRLKLDKGKTYYDRIVIDQKITQDVMGQRQITAQNIGLASKLQVLDVGPQGAMRIQYTYIWSRLKTNNPMLPIDYDSKRPDPVPAGAEGFAALLGESYVLELTPSGKVLKVEGIKELQEAVFKKLPPGVQGTTTMQSLDPFFDAESVKQTAESTFAVYPDQPVEPDSTWTDKMSMNMGFPITVESKWTLLKHEGGVATVAQASSIRSNPGAPPLDVGGMKMKADLSGTQQGTMQIAEKTGLITSHRVLQQLKGDLKIVVSADAPPLMTIPTAWDTQVTIEMGDKMWESSPQ